MSDDARCHIRCTCPKCGAVTIHFDQGVRWEKIARIEYTQICRKCGFLFSWTADADGVTYESE